MKLLQFLHKFNLQELGCPTQLCRPIYEVCSDRCQNSAKICLTTCRSHHWKGSRAREVGYRDRQGASTKLLQQLNGNKRLRKYSYSKMRPRLSAIKIDQVTVRQISPLRYMPNSPPTPFIICDNQIKECLVNKGHLYQISCE